MIYQIIKDQNYLVPKETSQEAKEQSLKEERTKEIKGMERCDAKRQKERNSLLIR